jgi:hypothetical protein
VTAALATAPRGSAGAQARDPARLYATGRHRAPAPADGVLRRCACGGSCPRCRGSAVHPKLAINTPGDAFEREADAAAEAVMSGAAAGSASPAPPGLRRCACGGSCPSCKQEKKEEELHREDAGGGAPGFAPPAVHDVLASPGRPLPGSTRGFMESRFGADFSGVRVHDDARAADSARAVDAHAYTVGRDLVFGAGRYAPGTAAGDRLLAHELAHVVQQRGGAGVRRLQRRVVDDDKHLPCRGVAGRSAAEMTVWENDAAAKAEAAAAALRASPLGEAARAAVWKWFHLDYNEPRVRCRFVVALAERFAAIARAIRDDVRVYRCVETGEPEGSCNDGDAVAVTVIDLWPRRMDLCSSFWNLAPDTKAEALLHEWAHAEYPIRGLDDERSFGFDNAECYAALAFDLAGKPGAADPKVCLPATGTLPPLDAAGVASKCPGNVFGGISLTAGYLYGLGGKHYGTLGGGWELKFPISTMHEWEVSVGPRITAAIPREEGGERPPTAYFLGIRTALQFRNRPYRKGASFQVGGFAELGGASIPGFGESSSSGLNPYASGGVTAGFSWLLGKDKALQLFVDVGGGVGLDTGDDRQFKWFQSGLGVGLVVQ